MRVGMGSKHALSSYYRQRGRLLMETMETRAGYSIQQRETSV